MFLILFLRKYTLKATDKYNSNINTNNNNNNYNNYNNYNFIEND